MSSELRDRVDALESENDRLRFAIDAHERVKASNLKLITRLRRYEALGAAWRAHDAACAAYWAHVEKRPPLAVPDSPEQRAWEKERLRLEAVAGDTLDAKDTAGAALAAESEGK